MAFDCIRKAALLPGKTVPLKLDMLPGEPVVHVEHLGDENASYINDEIARANTKMAAAGVKAKKLSVGKLKELRTRQRQDLKHAIRHLEAKHDDGKAATDADIPEFIESLPDDVVVIVWDFASSSETFRTVVIEGDPKELAEK